MSKVAGKDDRQNVKVVCRVRPTNRIEINKGLSSCVKEQEELKFIRCSFVLTL